MESSKSDKGNRLFIRVSEAEKEEIKDAAKRSGLLMSAWIRFVALKAARGEKLNNLPRTSKPTPRT